MRALLIGVLLTLPCGGCEMAKSQVQVSAAAERKSEPTNRPDFETNVKPIFQARCQPCHFQGGQVYDKMPFDKPETVTRLGTKLFTRIKDEKERAVIREFLGQP